MGERELLLLGILKMQRQHGYQINEFIERNLCNVTDMKKATAYATLERLAKAGLVEVQAEQVGNRPTRRVYAITPDGDARFQELLRENLTAADRLILPGTIGLMFLDHLGREEQRAYLRQRLDDVAAQLATLGRAPMHRYQRGVTLAIARQTALLEADRDWLAGVIAGLEEGEA